MSRLIWGCILLAAALSLIGMDKATAKIRRLVKIGDALTNLTKATEALRRGDRGAAARRVGSACTALRSVVRRKEPSCDDKLAPMLYDLEEVRDDLYLPRGQTADAIDTIEDLTQKIAEATSFRRRRG